MEQFINLFVLYVPNIILAAITLFVGFWIIKRITNAIAFQIAKGEIDSTLKPFLISLISVGLKIMLLLSVAAILGIETTSFVAVITAASFAIGLALQGSLSNFAGGVLILIFKPYKVGDYIAVQGFEGEVSGIQLFNTLIKTIDNKIVIIPNGPLAGGNIVNFTAEPLRRVDILCTLDVSADMQKVKSVFFNICSKEEKILTEPAPFVAVELGLNVTKYTIRAWCKTENYWDMYFYLNENIKIEFEKEGITGPLPKSLIYTQGV